jgi:type VI secretion system protein ImpM
MYTWSLGYYGKLPVSPEFLHHRAAGPEIDELDRWLREGMYYAKSAAGSSWSADFAQGDAWSFLYFPRDPGRFMIGSLKPSRDKAGREFPFLVYLLLKREEFRREPWCAPMHFKDFLQQSHRLLSQVAVENDVARLHFRLQALAPVDDPQGPSAETRYHSELLAHRLHDHWTEIFGQVDQIQIDELFARLLHGTTDQPLSKGHEAKLPLFPLVTQETYDLPFWVDIVFRAWGSAKEAGMVMWNRSPSKVKPLSFISTKVATPHMLYWLIYPESWENGDRGTGSLGAGLSESEHNLLNDQTVTMDTFLERLSVLKKAS